MKNIALDLVKLKTNSNKLFEGDTVKFIASHYAENCCFPKPDSYRMANRWPDTDYYGGCKQNGYIKPADEMVEAIKDDFNKGELDTTGTNIDEVVDKLVEWSRQEYSSYIAYATNTDQDRTESLLLAAKREASRYRKGILLVGEPGVGKTELLTSFMKHGVCSEYARVDKQNVNGINRDKTHLEYEFDHRKVFRYNDLKRSYLRDPQSKLYNECLDAPFAFIDDLFYAGDSGEGKLFGTQSNFMQELLTYRFDHDYYTFATANFAIDTLDRPENAAFKDRLLSMFNILDVTGKSRRQRDLDLI